VAERRWVGQYDYKSGIVLLRDPQTGIHYLEQFGFRWRGNQGGHYSEYGIMDEAEAERAKRLIESDKPTDEVDAELDLMVI
jgi:hypothetical protein